MDYEQKLVTTARSRDESRMAHSRANLLMPLQQAKRDRVALLRRRLLSCSPADPWLAVSLLPLVCVVTKHCRLRTVARHGGFRDLAGNAARPRARGLAQAEIVGAGGAR